MLVIGLIKEGKVPADNRVALTPSQCKWIFKNYTDIKIIVESSANRCFSDMEYAHVGVEVKEDLSECSVLFGIKEVPILKLMADKTYLFFSHTRKKQPFNQKLFHTLMDKNITLIDYECLEHDDGQRIIGFGFFAGIVGGHNGMMAYGNRTKQFQLGRVFEVKDYRELIHTYFGLKLPPVKIIVTGSGRVSHGILEIMNLMDVQEVDLDEYKSKQFSYPVYLQLKGGDLYKHKKTGTYNRNHFHQHAEEYDCLFEQYISHTDILMNGIFWDKTIPRLFEMETMQRKNFAIKTIADITDDANGSIPCNLGDTTKENPIYGVDKLTGKKTLPYVETSVDVMAVGNLPNELPRDASRYFGEQLIKYVLDDIVKGGSNVVDKATVLRKGKLTTHFEYLQDYAKH